MYSGSGSDAPTGGCVAQGGRGSVRAECAPSHDRAWDPANGAHSDAPARKAPSKNSVKFPVGSNRAVILYVTICTTRRIPVLANPQAFDCIVAAFRQASYWRVGRFVVMPDHIHFFCGPGIWPPYDFHKWVSFLKSSISRTFPLPLRERVEGWNTGGRGSVRADGGFLSLNLRRRVQRLRPFLECLACMVILLGV